MQYYRPILLLLLKTPFLPPPRRPALCGEPARPLPARPRRSGGDAFRDGPMAARRAGGEQHCFPSPSRLAPLSPPEQPGPAPGTVSQAPLRTKGWEGGPTPCWVSPGLSSALGVSLLLSFPSRGSALASLTVSRPLQPFGDAVCGSGAELLT